MANLVQDQDAWHQVVSIYLPVAILVGILCFASQDGINNVRNLVGQERGYRVTHLMELLRPGALEKVIVWKSLKPCCLTNGETAALSRVVVNKVVAILGNMASHGGTWMVPELDAEAVNELA